MRLVFAGTPEFAAAPLRALLAAGADVAAVFTQPDRPAGRGRQLATSPVKQVAQAHSIGVYQPSSLRDAAAQDELRQLAPDCLLVIAYGLILPPAVLAIPPRGALNVHASLLPRWRGAAPIQRALQAGDAQTGLCLMQMEAGLDTGPVLARSSLPIDPATTGGELHDALVQKACDCLPVWLQAFANGQLVAEPQPLQGVSYAHKLSKDEARIDWAADAPQVARSVRAFDPWPVATARLDEVVIRLWGASEVSDTADAPPGQILAVDEQGLHIACGRGTVRIRELQWPGGRRLPAHELLRGHPIVGQRFAD